jgi:hypothetical protein
MPGRGFCGESELARIVFRFEFRVSSFELLETLGLVVYTEPGVFASWRLR